MLRYLSSPLDYILLFYKNILLEIAAGKGSANMRLAGLGTSGKRNKSGTEERHPLFSMQLETLIDTVKYRNS